MLTHPPNRDGGFPHLDLFDKREWGLVIYDEVHLLPAPVFRATARIQARRRLGLTATLIREDGAEPLVFSLVGPKRYDTAWRELEYAGWIAGAERTELRVPLGPEQRMVYALADERKRFVLAEPEPQVRANPPLLARPLQQRDQPLPCSAARHHRVRERRLRPRPQGPNQEATRAAPRSAAPMAAP